MLLYIYSAHPHVLPITSSIEFLPPFLPGCLRPLGMQDGRIPDSSIKASSYYRERSAPSRGRLHLAIQDSSISAGVTGGWCQSYRKNQWLQVDLGFVASVGKFATQGKQEHDFWVTKYYLGYRIGANGSFSFYQQNRTVKVTLNILAQQFKMHQYSKMGFTRRCRELRLLPH